MLSRRQDAAQPPHDMQEGRRHLAGGWIEVDKAHGLRCFTRGSLLKFWQNTEAAVTPLAATLVFCKQKHRVVKLAVGPCDTLTGRKRCTRYVCVRRRLS